MTGSRLPHQERSRVRVYPGFNALYYSFYLDGLRSSGRRLRFSARDFPRLGHHCLALVFEGETPGRVVISASDGPALDPRALEWCDVYAKVNLAQDLESYGLAPELRQRLLAIGPSFPVTVDPPLRAWGRAAANLVRGGWPSRGLKQHFADYRRQYRYRLPLACYQPGESLADYVFFASRLWRNEPETNRLRANFIAACRSRPGLTIDGGFVKRPLDDVPGFAEWTIDRRFTIADYVAATRRSAVVFNTPAVRDCHGWKLAEFLALGKAILSTPLSRALPSPLEHGVHLHLVDGSVAAIEDGLDRVLGDPAYRESLGAAASAYYRQHLAPERVLARIETALSDQVRVARAG